jgi:hypothetical protein
MKNASHTRHTPPGRLGQQGVALVVTVIVVAVLAVVGVAFMQSTSIDRLSSRTVADYYRAQLAAEAGLAAAEVVLAGAMTNDTFIVVANTNNQLFVGNGIAGSTDFSYTPAFSTSPNVTNPVAPIVTGGVPAATLGGGVVFTNAIPGGLSVTSPPVSWVYVTNAAGVTNARFAYWVEDLGGKLDLSVVGTNTTDPAARRPTGTNPSEIALWAVLDNTAVSAVASGGAGNALVAARSNLLTAATARVAEPLVTVDIMADLAAGLVHDTNEPMLIPFGFGYLDQGLPKYDLNTNITPLGVDSIAGIINSNLPNFIQRGGGFTNFAGGGATNASAYDPYSYLQTIAANIIDYADVDSDPTTDGTPLTTNLVRPRYRGVDSYPFINEISKRWVLTGNVVTNVGGVAGRGITIETTDFFELWNLSSQTASGTFTFVSVHRQTGNAGFLPITFATPLWASNAGGLVSGGVTTNVFPGVTIPPNAFAVYASPTVTNFFFSPTTNSNTIVLNGETNSSFYFTAWNGVFMDAVLGGLFRVGPWSGAGLPLNSPTNRANLPSFIYQNAAGTGFGDPAVGDPRATIYLSRPVDATAYVNRTSFGGRNDRGLPTNDSFAQVSPSSWPDGGHDSQRGNPAGSQATAPTSVALAVYSNVPPARISNAGFYSNVTELGAIFDPIQWRVPALNAWQGRWTTLPAGASAIADNGFGGGNTLRIGRAEHSRFTNDGLRAAQLLDLFAVGATNSLGTVLNRVAGRINLNTATTNVLRALAAGVNHSSDPALQPGATNYYVPASAVDAFVTGVTNFRIAAPFYSANQLPSISTNTVSSDWPTNSVFGNTSPSGMGITAWNDGAAEEWFRKIHAISTVRSRNFIVHIVGEALPANNFSTPLSSYRMVAQIHVEPLRDAGGLTTNSRANLIRAWGL